MTKEECNAIRSLERAFKKCSDLNIKFRSMDDVFYYATEEAINAPSANEGIYDPIANAIQEHVDGTGFVCTYSSFVGSGGW